MPTSPLPKSPLSAQQTMATGPNSLGSRSCCSLRSLAMPILTTITVISVCTAIFYAGRSSQLQSLQENRFDSLPLALATATANVGGKYSIATGQVDDDAEGFFMLDHNSGLLQCVAIYPRTGRFLAQFSVNVSEALGTSGKGGDYLIVTGQASFPRASNRPAAPSVIYVLDTVSGNYACYGIPFDRGAVASNRPQQGGMVLLTTGSASTIPDRDKLR